MKSWQLLYERLFLHAETYDKSLHFLWPIKVIHKAEIVGAICATGFDMLFGLQTVRSRTVSIPVVSAFVFGTKEQWNKDILQGFLQDGGHLFAKSSYLFVASSAYAWETKCLLLFLVEMRDVKKGPLWEREVSSHSRNKRTETALAGQFYLNTIKPLMLIKKLFGINYGDPS